MSGKDDGDELCTRASLTFERSDISSLGFISLCGCPLDIVR